ncbi:MAG: penicillin-binding protein activator [Porticoccaceae bacterium]
MNTKLFLSIFYAGCILAFIGGCAPISTQDSVIPRITAVPQDSDTSRSIVREAEQTVISAGAVDPLRRDTLLLDAAILFAQAGDIANSRETLGLITADNLGDSLFIEYSLLGLELDIASHSHTEAQQWLIQPRFVAVKPTLGMSFSRRILSLESDLNYAMGDLETSVGKLIQLGESFNERKILGQGSIGLIHDKIWRQLNELPFETLQKPRPGDRDTLAGWYKLAAAVRYQQGDPVAQQSRFSIWQQRWKNHPGAKRPPSALTGRIQGRAPKNIALLLPLQDVYEIPSNTLLNGFMSGYYQKLAQGSAVPNVSIFDTSARPVADAYNQAVDSGAQLVIGPMRQSQVEELLSLPALDVPTLTLNRVDKNIESPPENLIQFGLSALDEVDQIADRAWLEGQTNVLLIAPDSGWGQRATEYFINSWTARGGLVTGAVSYPSTVKDFTKLLEKPLEINLSEKRALEMRRFINSSLSYTARRRNDIDLVVVLGYSEKVRQIKPSLDFLYAGDLPVYSSSHIYNGTQQIELNRDLSGIEFGAMNWTLDGHMPRPLQPDQRLPTAYRQLYALGYDAFMLHAMLGEMEKPDAVPVFGSTGMLTLSDGVIKRHEKWAVFKKGQVVPALP